MMLNTLQQLLEAANAFKTSRLILSAVELRLFDVFQGNTLTSAEVAGRTGTDPRGADRLLNALVTTGLVTKEQGRFGLSELASKHLVTTGPGFQGGLNHSIHLYKTWGTLTGAVKAGTSVAGITEDINDRDSEWLEAFIAAMHARGVAQGRELAAMLDLTAVGRTLDVGGGSGAFTFGFIERNPDITGVILDLPNVVPITQRYIDRAGFAEKVTVMAGDYRKDDFGSGFDLVLMSAIIHINNDDENRLLIKKGAGALNPGGQLVIMDHVMNPERTEPAIGALFALNMLVGTTHGDTYTETEIRGWMNDAGLTSIRLLTSATGMQVMTGMKG